MNRSGRGARRARGWWGGRGQGEVSPNFNGRPIRVRQPMTMAMTMAMTVAMTGSGFWRSDDAFGHTTSADGAGSTAGSELRDIGRMSSSSTRLTVVKRPASPSANLSQALQQPPSLEGYLLKLSTRRAWRVGAAPGFGPARNSLNRATLVESKRASQETVSNAIAPHPLPIAPLCASSHPCTRACRPLLVFQSFRVAPALTSPGVRLTSSPCFPSPPNTLVCAARSPIPAVRRTSRRVPAAMVRGSRRLPCVLGDEDCGGVRAGPERRHQPPSHVEAGARQRSG